MRFVLTFLVILCAASIFAQAPYTFNYQGAVREDDGSTLANQEIGIRISINSDSQTVFAERHSVTTNANGIFSLKVGTGIQEQSSLKQVDWAGGQLFMQVEIDKDGGDDYGIVSSSELSSVPYAIHSGNGSQWTTADQGIYYGGNLTSQEAPIQPIIRDVTIISDDDVSTGIQLQDLGQGGETYSIASTNNSSSLGGGKFLIYNDSGLGHASDKIRLLINRQGNMGIGVDPAAKLHVSHGDVYIDDFTKGVIMKSPDGNCWKMQVSNQGQPVFNSVDCPE